MVTINACSNFFLDKVLTAIKYLLHQTCKLDQGRLQLVKGFHRNPKIQQSVSHEPVSVFHQKSLRQKDDFSIAAKQKTC